MWIDRSSIARDGKATRFKLKLQLKQDSGYSIQTASINCATRAYDMLSTTLYDAAGNQTQTSTRAPGTATGTMANANVLRVVCDAQAASAAVVPAGQPDWRLVRKDAEGQMWVDARSVRPRDGYRWYRVRMQLPTMQGYGYSEAIADCTNRKSQLLLTSIERDGKVVASSEPAEKKWIPITSSQILAVVCT